MRYLSGILWLLLGKIIFTVDISDDIGGDFALDSKSRFSLLILILFLFHLSTKDMECLKINPVVSQLKGEIQLVTVNPLYHRSQGSAGS